MGLTAISGLKFDFFSFRGLRLDGPLENERASAANQAVEPPAVMTVAPRQACLCHIRRSHAMFLYVDS
jgi:hypothetical protein